MAFTLNSVVAYGVEAEEPLNNHYKQVLILNITSLATDATLALGTYAGTFWTAVGGTQPGATALKAIQQIQTLALSFLSAQSTAMAPRIQVLTTAANDNEYVLTMAGTNTLLPNIVFDASTAPTSNILVLEWVLKANQQPVYVEA